MPAPANNAAAVRRDGDALVFSGALLRDAVPALWRELPKHGDGIRRLDLASVDRIDSAGLALLSSLAARGDGTLTVSGSPPGLDALRSAYRLGDALGFTHP